jgi:hypothetical protein
LAYVNTTFFPKTNYIKDFASRLAARIQKGRVYQAVASLFSDATLDLNFAATKTLDPKVTFTRASTGTYVDANGVIQSAAVNEARFDHDPTTGVSLGLLIEESRTNAIDYSETFSAPLWGNVLLGTGSNPQVTSSAEASPGLTSPTRLVCNLNGGTTSGDISYIQKTSTYTANQTGTIYLKSNTGSNQQVYFRAGATVSIVTVTPTWQRFEVKETSFSGGGNFNIGTRGGTGSDDSIDILIWGAQLEVGPFPTSYIPTSGATATRAADIAEITGDNFNSWYNNIGGTFCVNCNSADGVNGVFSVGTATNPNEGLNYDFSGFNSLSADVVLNGTINPVGSAHKFAFTSQTGTISLYADGVLQDFDTATNAQRDAIVMTIGNRTTFGGGVGSTYLNGHIARFTYWPTRLTNEQLQEVTQ